MGLALLSCLTSVFTSFTVWSWDLHAPWGNTPLHHSILYMTSLLITSFLMYITSLHMSIVQVCLWGCSHKQQTVSVNTLYIVVHVYIRTFRQKYMYQALVTQNQYSGDIRPGVRENFVLRSYFNCFMWWPTHQCLLCRDVLLKCGAIWLELSRTDQTSALLIG